MLMTHYTVHSPTTGRTLKISYKNGKFFRLEILSGKKFAPGQTWNLGTVIPATEDEMESYREKYPTITYTKVEKQASTYQQYVGAWHGFYEKFMGYPPKFTGMDGKALNQIKTYLTKVGGNEVEGLELFEILLLNWHKLDKFHQENTDLKYINSRLNPLLNAVKKANQAGTGGADNSVRL
tara:strand:+ start:8193 stop:8732 length:540 start_codon:yes stop_codon:yes gene_type:complete